jgi:hypothetical protein
LIARPQEPALHHVSGLTADELAQISDGTDFSPNDPILARLLHRVQQATADKLRESVEQTRNRVITDLINRPTDHRAQVFEFSGRVLSFSTLTASDTRSDQRLHVVRLLAENRLECLVAIPVTEIASAPTPIPRRWPAGKMLDEQVTVRGFFFANKKPNAELVIALGMHGDDSAGAPNAIPVFVANRLAWYPDKSSKLFPVRPVELLLASNGVDITFGDDVKRNISGPFSALDSEPFYQLLRATSRLDRNALHLQSVQFTECLKNPLDHQSNLLQLTGKVRRITQIQSGQPLPGRDHYYQIDLIVPLDNQQILIRGNNRPDSNRRSSQPLILENRCPIICCTSELPAAEQELVGKHILFTGFFFKLWQFESELSSRPDSPQTICPLVIGFVSSTDPGYSNQFNIWVAVGGSGMLAAALMVWAFLRWDDSKRVPPNDRGKLPDQIEFRK